jgi:hypothetical protein
MTGYIFHTRMLNRSYENVALKRTNSLLITNSGLDQHKAKQHSKYTVLLRTVFKRQMNPTWYSQPGQSGLN